MAITENKVVRSTVAASSPQTVGMSTTGTPKGLLVFLAFNSIASDGVSAVTYGGTSLSRVARALDLSGETGGVYAYFLGAAVPTGSQDLVITHSHGTSARQIVAIFFDASSDMEAPTAWAGVWEGDQANPQGAINSGADVAARYVCIHSGQNAVGNLSLLTGMSSVIDSGSVACNVDYGTQVTVVSKQTTPSSGSFTIGYTVASDDVAMVALGVKESATGTPIAGSETFALTDTAGAAISATRTETLGITELPSIIGTSATQDSEVTTENAPSVGVTGPADVWALSDPAPVVDIGKTASESFALAETLEALGLSGAEAHSLTPETAALALAAADALSLAAEAAGLLVTGSETHTITDVAAAVEQLFAGSDSLALTGEEAAFPIPHAYSRSDTLALSPEQATLALSATLDDALTVSDSALLQAAFALSDALALTEGEPTVAEVKAAADALALSVEAASVEELTPEAPYTHTRLPQEGADAGVLTAAETLNLLTALVLDSISTTAVEEQTTSGVVQDAVATGAADEVALDAVDS